MRSFFSCYFGLFVLKTILVNPINFNSTIYIYIYILNKETIRIYDYEIGGMDLHE